MIMLCTLGSKMLNYNHKKQGNNTFINFYWFHHIQLTGKKKDTTLLYMLLVGILYLDLNPERSRSHTTDTNEVESMVQGPRSPTSKVLESLTRNIFIKVKETRISSYIGQLLDLALLYIKYRYSKRDGLVRIFYSFHVMSFFWKLFSLSLVIY